MIKQNASIFYFSDGNDVNEFLFSGWSMLLYASSSVLPEVIEHLLKLGADPNLHKGIWLVEWLSNYL